MSSLLFSWINEDLQLGKHVTNFDSDFRNGYLIGEILAKFNQQRDFANFYNKTNAEAKVR